MIKEGLVADAFLMIRDQIPPTQEILKDVFFNQAVILMYANEVDRELISFCAKILGKTAKEVEDVISPSFLMLFPKEMQEKMEKAEKALVTEDKGSLLLTALSELSGDFKKNLSS